MGTGIRAATVVGGLFERGVAGASPSSWMRFAWTEMLSTQPSRYASYSNFCRVTGTPEELIVDFGTNPSPFQYSPEPIVVTQRIVTNFYTAKRM